MNLKEAQKMFNDILVEEGCARATIDKIKVLALGGHERAITSLIEIGVYAATAVQGIWHEKHPSLFGYSNEDALTLRRIMLKLFSGAGCVIPTITRLPVIHVTWDNQEKRVQVQDISRGPSQPASKDKLQRQQMMLDGLTPMTGYLGREGFARFVYDMEIRPLWLGAHFGIHPMPAQFEGLAPLTSNNVSRWATAAKEWIWSKHAKEIRTVNTPWRFLALSNPTEKGEGVMKVLKTGETRPYTDGELRDFIQRLFAKALKRAKRA